MTTTFKSADGTLRCRACGLHADACTCDADSAFQALAREVAEQLARQPPASPLRATPPDGWTMDDC